ncbi:hypothetical protein JMUB6875_48170 [Nocardia sp. JMUB6875]|uniref:hypothetical protein n=1 Tax=Nocardia sp. JMUB6875 TaxID=3158170 RepID=UPI0032E58D91
MFTTLLAFHVTVAIGLAVLLGLQCLTVSQIVDASQPFPNRRGQVLAITAVPVVTVLVAVTGFILIGDGAHGGPWTGAGVLSTAIIGSMSGWTRRKLRAGVHLPGSRAMTAVLWGAPAFVMAGTFLMAARPMNPLGAVAPVLVAAAVTGVAAVRTTPVRPQVA